MALTASQKNKIRQRIGDSEREQAKNSGLTESELGRIRENFYRNDRGTPAEVDEEYINKYFEDARNFALKTSQDRKTLNYKTATAPTTGRYLDTLSDVESDLKNRGRRIQEYLYANKGSIDRESYESMRSSIDALTGGKSIVGEFRRAIDSFGKFESEEDYNQQMKALQDYESMMAVDTESEKKEIEKLGKILDEYRFLTRWMTDENGQARADYIRSTYGDEKAMQDQISQRTAYLSQAQRLQEGVRLGSVGNKDSENYDEEYDYYANQRSFGIPTAEDLNTYDKMMDQTTWSTDSEGRLFDAYGTEVDPNNRDEQGRIIHPNQNNYDTTDKLGIFLSADAGEIEDAAARYATTGATWDTILGEGKEKNWDQMDEKEISNYYYYLNKFGEEAANNYLSSIQEALNQRKGFERAKAMEDNVALELLFGVEAGFDQFNSGVTGVRNAILGEDDYVPVTSTQFASQKVREDLADADLPAWFNFKTGKFESKILGNSVGQMAYDTVTTTSNMLPSVLASTVIGAVNPTAGAAVGTTLMGASAGGNAYTEMINLGYDVGQAQTYAALVGGSEIVLESILGGVSKLGGGLAAKGATKLLGKADNALAKFAIKFGNTAAGKVLVNALEESSEEFVQSILEPVFRDQIFGTNEGVDIEEALYSALLGAVTGGMFEGGDVASQAMVNSYNTNATGREIIRAEGGVDALKALAMDVAGANTKLTKQAGKVSSEVATGTGFDKVTAAIKNSENQKKVGKLYQAVQQSVSKSNASDIASVLEEKGYDPKSAKNIAEAVVAQMDGKELDAFQEGTLKAYAGDTKIDQAVEQLMNDTESAFAKRTGNMDTFNIGIAFGKGIAPTATQEVKSADIKVSDDGKTKVSGGREIPIKFADNGQIATDNGAVIKVDDVEFSSNREGYVVEAISNLRLTANAANKLFDSIDLKNMTDAQAVEFVTGIQKAYELGRENNLAELPTHPLTKNLTSEQRMEAYSAGLGVRNKETAARQKAATESKQKAEKAERKSGVYFVSEDQQVSDIDAFLKNSSGLSGQQTSGIAAMKHLSKAIGAEFYVFKSYAKDGKRYYIDENGVEKPAPNGWYDTATGKIYIDLYAGQTARGTMLFTIAHELTHFIRQNSPEKFNALADIVVNKSNLKGKISERIEQKMNEAKDRGEPISRDTAYEEVIADSMETILTSGRVFELMNEIQQQDKTLWEQIRDWFMDFIKSIREAYKGVDADTVEGQAIAEMDDVLKELEQVFAEGLVDAGENFQTAEKNTTDGGLKMQARSVNGVQIVWIENSGLTNNQLRSHAAIAQYIANHIGDYYRIIESGQKVYIGEDLPGEYTQSRYTSLLKNRNPSGLKAKNKAVTALGEMIEIATNRRWEKTNHPNSKDAKYGMYRYDTKFAFPIKDRAGKMVSVKAYDAELLIRNASDGKKYLYDVVNINEDTAVAINLLNREARSGSYKTASQSDVINDNVAQNSTEVKGKSATVASAVLKSERTDTDGNQLSEDQQAYFADSKVRDAEGKLQVMYRGDSEDVNVFDRKKSRPSNLYGRGFYFTSSKSHAGQYGDARAFYLNIKNPLRPNQHSITKEQMLKFLKAIEDDGEDYDLYNYGENATASSVLHSVWGKGDFEMLQDVSASAIGDLVAAVELFNSINGTDYDGLILPTETVIFQSEQAKLISNKTPTSNPDIRYSRREIIGPSGTNYGEGVYLDSTFLDGLTDDERIELIRDYITELGGSTFQVYDKSGRATDVLIVESTKKFVNRQGRRVPVLKDLKFYIKPKVKQEAIALIDEVFDAAKYVGKEPANHPHDWVDNNGQNDWDVWETYLQEKNNTVWKAKLRIANSVNGEKILYEIFPIEKVEEAQAKGTTTTNPNVAQPAPNVNNNNSTLNSNRTTESLSTRSILTNALEGVAQNEWEQNKLNEYKENIAKVEEMESRLQEINSQLYPFGKKMPQKERIALQDEAVGLRNKITNIDKKLLRLEATKPLQNVLNRERARVRREMKQKAEERISEVKAEAAQRLKRRSEGHAATEMRKKIRKTIRELDKILNRGDKKRNVKENMKDFVTKATQSAELLFKESYPNEDILREGFQRVNLRPSEQVHYDEARKIMEQIQTLGTSYDTIDEVTKLRGKLDYRISKLREAFDQERMLLNETKVAKVLNDLAGAYAELKNSEYSYIVEAYNEQVHEHLASLAEGMGGATIRSMTMSQLEDLYKAYRMVLETVRNSNKLFNEDIKLTRQQVSEEVIREILAQKKRNPLWSKAEISRNKFFWNNLKPIYATERVGSQTFSKVMNGLFEGQYKWASTMQKSRDFQQEISKKYKANGWDMNTSYAFTSSGGLDFELNLGQILSLYAYSKRSAAHDHITHGGIVFDKNTEVKIKENGIPVTRLKREATTYSISDEILGEILSKLTPEQKLFVDDMQKYLSETMGGLGNEVSMKLYGVKLFGEENYFPLKSAGQYMEKAREADLKKDQGHTSIVNAGFTHAVKPNAKNPIIINSFVDVWANHVNDMAMYNGMVLPMEDFRKVYNFHTPFYEGTSTTSVNGALENAFGNEAVKYFDQLYQELNSGAVTDPRESDMLKWVSKFKKASVMLSMSVVMQQPSAIGRAFALVDPKYFVGEKISENEQTKQWDELKKYAPVAIIKEMGGFDTHMGAGAKDYLLDKGFKDSKLRKFMKKLDEISAYLPSKADEITWVAIWQAVKRETKATNPHLAGEEFFKKAGRRFSEVIEKTQVYDSVLARSANMRSKTGLMTMATAFMAEPTTTINMVELALRSKKNVGRVLASVVTSIVVNNFLASWIYAARDDDEDETFLEKYAQAFTSGLVDDLNPITYYPFVKDIWSLFQGYDVERGDMSVIADVSDALKKTLQIIGKDTSEMNEEQLAKHHAQTWDAILTLADGVASVCGIPAKNVRREFSAAVNTVKTLTNGLGFSGTSLANAIGDSALDALPVANYLWMPDKADRLYTAIKNGDTDYVNRLKQEYGDDTKVSKAIQKGLKENDPRIYEAALKDIAGLPTERLKLQKEVMADGFAWEDVRNATVSIINKLTPDAAKAAPKKHGYYETDDFVTFVAKGQTSYANEAKKDIITTYQLNGKTEDEAIRSFKSSVSSQMKNAFNEGRVSASAAIHALVTYGEMDNTDATNKVESWKFEKEYGFQYGDRADAYKAGEISASELKKALTTVGGKTPAEADMQIKVYDWQKAGIDIDNDQTGIIKRYEEFCEAEGIDKRTYADFYKFYQESGEEGVAYSKTIECMPYIDSLSLSNKQKNALALSIWGESTVKKYKLW